MIFARTLSLMVVGRRRCASAAAVVTAAVTLIGVFGASGNAEASNTALLRLLQVLRDRGSISAQDYEDIRRVAEATEGDAPSPSTQPALTERVAAQEKAIAEIKAATAGTPAPVVSRALSGKWYERISLRGYAQLRYSETSLADGPALEVPNDRSVNPHESFVLRRGRLVFSGDPSDHLGLYTQVDFSASTGAADFSVQMRDLYGDVWFDRAKTYRVRLGQQKIPFGWSNLQSSQNRAALERADAINSALEGERDLGATFMWASPLARQRFRDITAQGLKGSGDYGVVAVGLYAGQGPNRSDQNGAPHLVARVSYPFKLTGGQFIELGVQAYHGRFVSPTQSITIGSTTFTPGQAAAGTRDQRVAVTVVAYPQPVGVEAEWTFGRGPALAADQRSIDAESLMGGHLQLNYKGRNALGTWFPFTRWNYYDGARKFARNAPRVAVNEVDLGVEFVRWADVELTAMYTRTLRRTRTSAFPYGTTRDANRVGFQVQWNY